MMVIYQLSFKEKVKLVNKKKRCATVLKDMTELTWHPNKLRLKKRASDDFLKAFEKK